MMSSCTLLVFAVCLWGASAVVPGFVEEELPMSLAEGLPVAHRDTVDESEHGRRLTSRSFTCFTSSTYTVGGFNSWIFQCANPGSMPAQYVNIKNPFNSELRIYTSEGDNCDNAYDGNTFYVYGNDTVESSGSDLTIWAGRALGSTTACIIVQCLQASSCEDLDLHYEVLSDAYRDCENGFSSHSTGYSVAIPTKPQTIGTNQDCRWWFQSSSSSRPPYVNLRFNLESNFDFIRVYDGSSTSAPLLRSLSGNGQDNVTKVVATQQNMLVRFTSDASGDAGGFVFYVGESDSGGGGGGGGGGGSNPREVGDISGPLAAGIVVIIAIGLIFYFRNRRRRQQQAANQPVIRQNPTTATATATTPSPAQPSPFSTLPPPPPASSAPPPTSQPPFSAGPAAPYSGPGGYALSLAPTAPATGGYPAGYPPTGPYGAPGPSAPPSGVFGRSGPGAPYGQGSGGPYGAPYGGGAPAGVYGATYPPQGAPGYPAAGPYGQTGPSHPGAPGYPGYQPQAPQGGPGYNL